MREMDIYHTISGQPDPTAGKALGKIIGEERKEQRLAEKTVKEICGLKKRSTAICSLIEHLSPLS